MSRRSTISAAVSAFVVAISGAAAVLGAAPTTAAAAPTAAPGGYTAVVPARILDTRPSHHPIAAHGVLALPVAGHGGVPATGVSAVVLNVTVTDTAIGGYLALYPQGGARPSTSNVNFGRGQTVANLVSVKLGAGGGVSVYNGAPGNVDVIADVAGYFTAGTPDQPGMFSALDPSRLLDTRTSHAIPGGGSTTLQVAGHGGVPASDVSAVALSVTATGPTSGGYVTVFPHGATRPTASNLNFGHGQTVANLVVVPVSADGQVDFYNGSTGPVQVIADIAGYYTGGVPTTGGSLAALGPLRVLDTRGSAENGPIQVPAHGSITLNLTSGPQRPVSGVAAAVFNLTVTNAAASGYVTAYPNGAALPTASNVNFGHGQTVPNLVAVKVGANGSVRLYNGAPGTIALIADLAGIYLDGTAGVVTGTVTDGVGHPLSGVGVGVADQAGFTRTGADGTYRVFGVPAGQHQVCFTVSDLTQGGDSPSGYLNECYNGVATGGTPTPVAVTAGQATTGIDASLDRAGAITGTVTDSTGHPLANVTVGVTSPPSTRPADYGTSTAADGTFAIKNLASGQYSVCFDANDSTTGGSSQTGYVAECFDGVPRIGTPTPVTVTAGAAPAVANAALVAGGAISGKVTDSAGQAIAGVQVTVNPNFVGVTSTAADGTYTVRNLAPGTAYQVCFDPSTAAGSYQPQCYNNVADGGTPTPVAVTAGQTRTGINAKLGAAGAISGTVTDTGGHGLADVWISAFSDTGNGAAAITDSHGSYRMTSLPAGTYTVCFSLTTATGGSSDATGYIDQCYNNAEADSAPTPITLAAGQSRTGINAKAAGGGAISGTVTDSSGQPVPFVGVTATDASGTFFQFSDTDETGKYTVRGLPTGSYSVCFDAGGDGSGLGYQPECYDNVAPSGTPTPVSITVGHTHSGIDAVLSTGGAIRGHVTVAGGAPAADVQVSVQTPDGTTSQGAITDDAGDYTVDGLVAGTYQVCFGSESFPTDPTSTGYAPECYDDVPTGGTPTPVTVTAGQTTSGIDASLAAGAAVSGTVTDSAGHPVSQVSVTVQSNSDPDAYGYANTDNDGTYRIIGLSGAADYTVCFDGSFTDNPPPTGYAPECYDDVPPGGAPTTFALAAGDNKTGVDAQLAAGGAISGTVTHANGQAYPDAYVGACPTAAGGCGGATSGSDGTYQINGLATGGYQVCFDSPQGTASACLPDTVPVTAGAVTPDVNGGPGD